MVEPSFQGVNRLFVLGFGNDTQRTSHPGYYLPNVELKGYKIIINGENFLDQLMKNNKHMKTLQKLLLVKEMITQLVVC